MRYYFRDKSKELGLLTQEEFFRDVAFATRYLDREDVRTVYKAILAIVWREIKAKGTIRLPSLCDIYLRQRPTMRCAGKYIPGTVVVQAHHNLSFSTLESVRVYVKKLEQENPGKLFDPAKRIERGGDITQL